MTVWADFPPENPVKNKSILLSGVWNDHDDVPGGDEIVVIASFITVRSDGTGYQWLISNFASLTEYNVVWKKWAEVPHYDYSNRPV